VPFVPEVKSPTDTRNFDQASVRQFPVDSFVNSSLR